MCAVSLAFHLEMTDSQNFDDCLNAIRKFIAHRGLPQTFYSDNASTFVSMAKFLSDHYSILAPEWKFIPPKSPWWGGFWERLVHSVKLCLKKSLHLTQLTCKEMETVLIETEGIINSRPITFISDSVNDSRPLTPAHFLLGKPFYITC